MNPFTSPPTIAHHPRRTLSQSALMRAYNAAVHCGKLEPGRLHRALGIAQSLRMVVLSNGQVDITNEDRTDFYMIRVVPQLRHVGACDCQDARKHGASWWCKHRIAVALVLRASELENSNG